MQNAFPVNISLFGPKPGVKHYFSCIWAYKCLRRAKQYVKTNEDRTYHKNKSWYPNVKTHFFS